MRYFPPQQKFYNIFYIIFINVCAQRDSVDIVYDTETNFSQDKVGQDSWSKKIDTLLKDTTMTKRILR